MTKAKSSEESWRSDEDVQPIKVFEEYRRAKRATLTWSGLSILVSFGVLWPRISGDKAAEGKDITLSWVAGGVAFPPLLVVLTFALIAIYMKLTFTWAERRLSLANSPLTFEESAGELAAVLQTVKAEAEEATNAIVTAHRSHLEGEAAAGRWDSLQRDAHQNLMDPVTVARSYTSDLEGIIAGIEAGSVGQSDLAVALRRQKAALATYEASLSETKGAGLTEYRKALKRGKQILDADTQLLLQEVGRIDRLVSNISGFHDSIGMSEKLRVLMLDYIPSFTLFWGAMVSVVVASYILIAFGPGF